ncbi:MAG: hypothetical protein ACTS73_05530 [Arsenophonus sp. NEOnobi-MAG3]
MMIAFACWGLLLILLRMDKKLVGVINTYQESEANWTELINGLLGARALTVSLMR